MRDKLKDLNYFINRIKTLKESITKFNFWIETGKTPNDRINIVKRAMVWDYLSLMSANYSSGKNLNELKDDLIKAINLCQESWDGFWKLKDANGSEYDQYILSAYDEMLWMLSLGYLLEIPNDDFKKLTDIIDRDGVKDFLFEFIIKAKFKDRRPISEESYSKFMGIPVIFSKLRLAIKETDKPTAEKLVKEFVTKHWYKNHKDAGWYNSHNSKHNTYSGYWSFETAAVVKILGLKDIDFRECQFYPKDMLNR